MFVESLETLEFFSAAFDHEWAYVMRAIEGSFRSKQLRGSRFDNEGSLDDVVVDSAMMFCGFPPSILDRPIDMSEVNPNA